MTISFFLILLLFAIQIGLVMVVLLNALSIPRLGKFAPIDPESPAEIPPVDVLIPARNEAERLPKTLDHLSPQLSASITLKVLDDSSTDGTLAIIRAYQQSNPHIQLVESSPLPDGWTGKNWACWQLAAASDASRIIFTDADVIWQEGALAAVLQASRELQADMLTVWPTQYLQTIWERLVIPMMSYATLAYLPWLGVHHLPFASLAAANGQCLSFTSAAYSRIGGHQAVRSSVIEDITLARRTKQNGLRLRMLDGDGLISCRMYTDWPSVRDGYAKNILAGHGNPLLLLASTLFHWLVFIFPFFWLLTGWLYPQWPLPDHQLWPTWPLFMMILTTGSRMLSAATTHQPLRDAFLLPLSVVLLTIIAGQALRWHFTQGGPSWKGRRIISKTSRSPGRRP